MFDNIVEGFFDAVFRMLMKLTASVFDFFSNVITGAFGYDVTRFINTFPVVKATYDIFVFTGIGMAVVFLAFALFKSLFGPLTESKEHPLILIGRFSFFTLLIWKGYDLITKVIFKIFEVPLKAVNAIIPVEENLSFTQMMSESASITGFSFGNIDREANTVALIMQALTPLITLIFLFVILVKFVKLFIEIIERYCLMNVLIFTSPLVYSTVTTKSTGPIFQSWCKMFAGQLLLILLNSFTLKAITSSVYSVAVQVTRVDAQSLNAISELIIGLGMIVAFLNIAQRFDTYLNQIGINAGITGGHFFGEAGAVFNSIVKTAKMAKGAVGGKAIIDRSGKFNEGKGIIGFMEKTGATISKKGLSTRMPMEKKDIPQPNNPFSKKSAYVSDMLSSNITKNKSATKKTGAGAVGKKQSHSNGGDAEIDSKSMGAVGTETEKGASSIDSAGIPLNDNSQAKTQKTNESIDKAMESAKDVHSSNNHPSSFSSPSSHSMSSPSIESPKQRPRETRTPDVSQEKFSRPSRPQQIPNATPPPKNSHEKG